MLRKHFENADTVRFLKDFHLLKIGTLCGIFSKEQDKIVATFHVSSRFLSFIISDKPLCDNKNIICIKDSYKNKSIELDCSNLDLVNLENNDVILRSGISIYKTNLKLLEVQGITLTASAIFYLDDFFVTKMRDGLYSVYDNETKEKQIQFRIKDNEGLTVLPYGNTIQFYKRYKPFATFCCKEQKIIENEKKLEEITDYFNSNKLPQAKCV